MPIRLATRAIIVHDNRLLLVNGFIPILNSDLWCAPGGGAEPHQSLEENVAREVHEETGLTVRVGKLALVNEFHAPDKNFHQVELFYRCDIIDGALSEDWQDPEGVVNNRRFFSARELDEIYLRPVSLPRIAFDPNAAVHYDHLEVMVPPKQD